MDRSTIMVDAGYLYAASGQLVAGSKARDRFQLDAGKAVDSLTDMASRITSVPPLRTYWYDGARRGIPTVEQQRIAALPRVKLRLGRLNWQNQQKGVDALIYRDLLTLARERSVCEAFLVSGDEDLREAVASAQDLGVRVHLIGIPSIRGSNRSEELTWEVDEVHVLDHSMVERFVEPLAERPSSEPTDTTIDEPSTEQRVAEAAADFGRAWREAALPDELDTLRAHYPRIPGTLDRELLTAVEQSVALRLRRNEPQRQAARTAFWDAIGPDQP